VDSRSFLINLLQHCAFVHHKSHMDGLRFKLTYPLHVRSVFWKHRMSYVCSLLLFAVPHALCNTHRRWPVAVCCATRTVQYAPPVACCCLLCHTHCAIRTAGGLLLFAVPHALCNTYRRWPGAVCCATRTVQYVPPVACCCMLCHTHCAIRTAGGLLLFAVPHALCNTYHYSLHNHRT
jgi:hypothetical protein